MVERQKNELNSPTWGSRIVSAFKGSRPRHERIWDEIEEIWTALNHFHEVAMANFTRLDSAIDGVIADLAGLRAQTGAMKEELARIGAELAAAQAEVDARAAKLEDARGGSMGNIS